MAVSQPPRVTIFTAMSGVSARHALDKLIVFANGQQHGRTINLIVVEDKMSAIYSRDIRELRDNESDQIRRRRGPNWHRDLETAEAYLDDPKALYHVLAHPLDYVRKLWVQGAEEAFHDANVQTAEDVFLLMHSTYYNTQAEEFVPSIDLEWLRVKLSSLKQEIGLVVTLIDDIDETVERLTVPPDALWYVPPSVAPYNEDEHAKETRLESTRRTMIERALDHMVVGLNWRRVEGLQASVLADVIGAKAHVVLATKHPLESTYRLVFPDDVACAAYLSHPITVARGLLRPVEGQPRRTDQRRGTSATMLIRQVQEVSTLMARSNVIVPFFPTTIDELRFATSYLDDRWDSPNPEDVLYSKPAEGGANPSKIIGDLDPGERQELHPMLLSLGKQVRTQVNARDRKLVEQAGLFGVGGLVVWRPFFGGVLAGGVLEEVRHRDTMVRFGIWKPGQVRCFIMHPPEDRLAERKQALIDPLRKSLVDPQTGDVPATLLALHESLPPSIENALMQGTLSGAELRNLVDPERAFVFREPGETVSALAGDESKRRRDRQQVEWERVARTARDSDSLPTELAPGDLIYPNNDQDCARFVDWIESQFKSQSTALDEHLC